jgi:glutamyl-tRNA reductase
MILGAGEMGELTVRNLLDSGVTGVIVANRTFQRAVALAEKFNGTPIMIHEIMEYVNKVDIIISSINSTDYIITKNKMIEMLGIDQLRTLFIVDISVPRSIDPEIGKLENIHLCNVDDLQKVINSNSEARKREAEKGFEIIESRVSNIIDHLRSCDIIPTLISIRTKAEEIRKDGILRAVDELKISDIEKELIDNVTKTMVNKILYHSEVKLREYSNTINIHKKEN